MATQKDKIERETSYRRGYHQAVVECLCLLKAAAEQHVDPAYLFDVLTTWEKQLAIWRGYVDETDLLAPPPKPLEAPRLRLIQKEEEQGDND